MKSTHMANTELKIYDTLKKHFSDEEAQTIVNYFEQKFDAKEIRRIKGQMIKWGFIFGIGFVLVILAGLFAILKLFFER